ncbi:hypothetical protein CBR_g3084 [Chara braunii]|uniref:Malic enzyme n=1 Tax=Chara braunii TaxID=69332 RepID=A0A388KER3_CHABU|nr:hypothetical protein CBR_g3084 [Chara braunii]|eukprot:GBG68540.1 hypothetical protein CBR_g3084 [Chara braunii]
MVTSGLSQSSVADKVKDWVSYASQAMWSPPPGRASTVKISSSVVPEVRQVGTEELATMRQMATDLQRYLFLRNLQEKDPGVFYELLMKNSQELLPYVYTPTVGEACQKYHKLPVKTHGLYIRPEHRGSILKLLKSLPQQDVKVVVVTDGERILGLGDLGAGGMGISEGKILLYTVIGGVDPMVCLPVCLDVGTDNASLLEDPEYKGLRQKRLRGAEYDEFVEEFVSALYAWQEHVLLQFEDFGNHNAFELLSKYRHQYCCFNDDIQGTACIVLAGLVAALRVTGGSFPEQKILFLGAGEAGTGIGELIAMALAKSYGVSLDEARRVCYFMDSKGLVCKSRTGLQSHKINFAHDIPYQATLVDAVRTLRPTALIGVSTIAGAFTREVLELMAEINERPIVFPLSNPTSKSECTFVDAFNWTAGRVVVAPKLIAETCAFMVESGLGTEPVDKGSSDWLSYVQSKMFAPGAAGGVQHLVVCPSDANANGRMRLHE